MKPKQFDKKSPKAKLPISIVVKKQVPEQQRPMDGTEFKDAEPKFILLNAQQIFDQCLMDTKGQNNQKQFTQR